jgi:hypothetical protein
LRFKAPNELQVTENQQPGSWIARDPVLATTKPSKALYHLSIKIYPGTDIEPDA